MFVWIPYFAVNQSTGKVFFCSEGTQNSMGGFWFAKFESSMSGGKLQFKPSQTAYIHEISFNNPLDMNEFTLAVNIAGDNNLTTSSTKLTTGKEWEMVAALSDSVYGRNGAKIQWGSSTTTGETLGDDHAYHAYNTPKGVKGSTTGNVYGIYDMASGFGDFTDTSNGNDSMIFTICPIEQMLDEFWDYLYNDTEVQDFLFYIQSNDAHEMYRDGTDTSEEYQRFAQDMRDKGFDVDSYFEKMWEQTRGVGILGMRDDMVSIMPLEEFTKLGLGRLFEEMARFPFFGYLGVGPVRGRMWGEEIVGLPPIDRPGFIWDSNILYAGVATTAAFRVTLR
jgi:hypothetical protein